MTSKLFPQRKFFNLNSEEQTQQQIQRRHQRIRISLLVSDSRFSSVDGVWYTHFDTIHLKICHFEAVLQHYHYNRHHHHQRQQKLSKGKQGKKCRDRVRKIRRWRQRQRFEPNANSIVSLKAYTCQLELMCGCKITEIFSHFIASVRSF